MAMTAAERVRAYRKHKRRRERPVTIWLTEAELDQIAERGYPGAQRGRRDQKGALAEAVEAFVSDCTFV